MRLLRIAVVALTLVPMFAQSPKSTGTVTATTAEFKIPLQPTANGVWIWNRADTPDNASEYSWTCYRQERSRAILLRLLLIQVPRIT